MIEKHLAEDVVDLLNDFIGDIYAGIGIYYEYDKLYRIKQIPESRMIPIHKMCISHLIITLTKWLEVYNRYNSIFPPEIIPVCRDLNKILRERKVVEFRNKCVGHILDNNTNKPITNSEISSRLSVIIDDNLSTFLKWLSDPTDNRYPTTVISVIMKLRDDIAYKYGIVPSDIINR